MYFLKREIYLSDILEHSLFRCRRILEERSSQLSRLKRHVYSLFCKHRKRIRVLFASEQKEGCNYLARCLEHLSTRGFIQLTSCAVQNLQAPSSSCFDIFIYHTRPYSLQNNPFSKQDHFFLNFSGYKILFDTHPCSLSDTFARFQDTSIPRIKHAPHRHFLKHFNVICPTTFLVDVFPRKRVLRNIDLSFHGAQPQVERALHLYKKARGGRLKSLRSHNRMSLRRVKLCIHAPHNTQSCLQHLYTLNAQSVMLSHASVNDIQLLPHATLVEGRDFPSFTLDTLTEKLDSLLHDEKKIEEYACRGYEAFLRGYSVEKSAYNLYEHFECAVC